MHGPSRSSTPSNPPSNNWAKLFFIAVVSLRRSRLSAGIRNHGKAFS